MPALKEELYTIEYIESLPEGQRAELLDGVVYDLAAPTRTHQKMVHYLDRIIGNHIADNHLPCEIYPAPFGVYLSENDYVEPDITVICDRDKLTEKGCIGAPDWVIEIVSPSTAHRDYLVKLLKYRTAGIRLYWIIDPDLKAVIVHDFRQDITQRYSFTDPVPVAICDGFTLNIERAFI